jgi:hypothetical protein
MCLVISMVCFAMAYSFYNQDSGIFYTNLLLGIFFLSLMVRNIIKTKNRLKS